MTTFHFTVDADILKKSVDVMKDIVTDVNLVFDIFGMHVWSQDPDKSTILKFDLPKAVCMEYHFNGFNGDEKKVYIGVHMGHLYKMIRNAPAGSSITMSLEDHIPTILKLSIQSPFKTSYISIQSILIPVTEPDFPQTVYSAVCEVPTATLQRVVRDISFLSRKLTIGYTSDTPTFLTVASAGDFSATSVSLCPSTDGLVWAYVDGESFYETFYGKQIEKFLKPSYSKTVSLSFKKESPLLFDYTTNFNEQNITLSLYSAPILT